MGSRSRTGPAHAGRVIVIGALPFVGFGEGVALGAKKPFDNSTRIVRRWCTEVTADGRTIQVPEDIVVDAQGRPIGARPKQ